MSFEPNVEVHAGESGRVLTELKTTLRDLGLQTIGMGAVLRATWTPGSYEPMQYRFWAPEGTGLVAIEGLLTTLGGEPSESVRQALNYLNVELETLRYYLGGNSVYVRADILPYVEKSQWLNPRELKLALTNVCAQQALFKDALEAIQGGRPWTQIKDAIKTYR